MIYVYILWILAFAVIVQAFTFQVFRRPFRTGKTSLTSVNPESILNPIRGARDFLPSDLRVRSHVFDAWRESARLFAFEEYDAPIVEQDELYTRRSNEDISDQLYSFTDGTGRRLALRPELTPSLARIILGHRANMTFPLKWYSIPQCWRNETSGKGRRREHFQWNMDIWGVPGQDAEAELLAAAVTSLKRLGLTKDDIVIRISNRKLLTEIMSGLGIPQELWTAVFIVIDKLDKIGVKEVQSHLMKLSIDEQQCKRLLELIQIKSLEAMATALGLSSLQDSVALQELAILFDLLHGYGLSEWMSFDPTIVRGLHYYTGIVFEGFDRAGEMRAVFGGGRYDNIVHSLDPTAEVIPAVGFGMGDVVLQDLLLMKNLVPDMSKPNVDTVVYAMEPHLKVRALQITTELRLEGRSVDLILLDSRKVKWALQRANRLGARELIVLAPDEDQRGEYLCKDLSTGEQKVMKYTGNV